MDANTTITTATKQLQVRAAEVGTPEQPSADSHVEGLINAGDELIKADEPKMHEQMFSRA